MGRGGPGIKQTGGHVIVPDLIKAGLILDPESLDNASLDTCTEFRSFLSVELHNVQAALVGNAVNDRQLFVNEQPDNLHKGGELADYCRCLIRRNIARGSFKKDEAESVSSGFHRRKGVFDVGYAADFDSYHNRVMGQGAW
jgi:hypothetical protein